MNRDFKNAFNAEDVKNLSSSEKAQERYASAIREYSKLCSDLTIMIKKLFNGVNGVRVTFTYISRPLEDGNGPMGRGASRVEVAKTSVTFNGRTITFIPEGIGYIGAKGKIAVDTGLRKSPLPSNAIFMQSSASNKEEWELTILGIGGKNIPLDSDLLQMLLKQALI